MQFEFDFYVKKALETRFNQRIRELQVYDGSTKAADFTFPPSQKAKSKGMIVELKCENKNSNAGKSLGKAVESDIKKLKGAFKTQYKDYDKVAIAMAYSADAQKALDAIDGMIPLAIPGSGITVGQKDKLKIYRWDAEEEMSKLAGNMSNFGFSDKCKRDASACASKGTASSSTTKPSSTSKASTTSSSPEKTSPTDKTGKTRKTGKTS